MSKDTVIVAAALAWREYQRYGTYVCQPDRSFRPDIDYLGFYADGAIQPIVAKIDEYLRPVTFTREEAARHRIAGRPWVARLIDRLLQSDARGEGEVYGVFLLSGPDDPETLHLPVAITHDGAHAWTQKQRYLTSDVLRRGVRRTSELETVVQ